MEIDWREVQAEYITDSNSSYRKLAKKYGIPVGTLQKRAIKEDWHQKKIQSGQNSVAKTVEIIEQGQANRLSRLMMVTDKLLVKIEQTVDEITAGTVTVDKATLKQITGALKDIKEIQSLKTDRDIREQEARIRNLERQAEAENKDNEIVIRVAGDNATEYCE
jgi:hypothetical protein